MRFPLIYDTTITREDFIRSLSAATGECDFREVNDVFVGWRWRISLTPIEPLVIGSLRLVRHRVEIVFAGMSEQEMDSFMQRFSAHYQRGGG